jgi:hypothetical protein
MSNLFHFCIYKLFLLAFLIEYNLLFIFGAPTFQPTALILPSSLRTGLVAYYPFDGNANDQSGNGNNGVAYGASLTTDRFGNTNSAYTFDGINDYIEVSSGSNFNFQTYLTISLWMRPLAPTIPCCYNVI